MKKIEEKDKLIKLIENTKYEKDGGKAKKDWNSYFSSKEAKIVSFG